MVTVNQTRECISHRKNFYTPVLHKALLKGLDDISDLQSEIDDSRTAVTFYWRGYPLIYEAAEKIMLGVKTMPEGLLMKVRVIDGTIH